MPKFHKAITTPVKGYKVFELKGKQLVCRGYKFGTKDKIVGSVHQNLDGNGNIEQPYLCSSGFHFCKKLVDCFRYYGMVPINLKGFVVCEVEGHKYITTDSGDKVATSELKITKILTKEEVAKLATYKEEKVGAISVKTYNRAIKKSFTFARNSSRKRSYYYVEVNGYFYTVPRVYAFEANKGAIVSVQITIEKTEIPTTQTHWTSYNTRRYSTRRVVKFL